MHMLIVGTRTAQTIAFAKDWVNRKVINDLKDGFQAVCAKEENEADCNAALGNRGACSWEGEPPVCTIAEISSSIDNWLKFAMIALFGLAFGQLVRLLSSHIFRKATKDQADIASFEDPFLANDSYDRWSKYSASYRDPDRGASSKRRGR